MREIDRLGPPGETMSRETVFFLTGDTAAWNAERRFVRQTAEKLCVVVAGGTEKMVAVCGVDRRMLRDGSITVTVRWDHDGFTMGIEPLLRKFTSGWGNLVFRFRFLSYFAKKLWSDFNFFRGKKKQRRLYRKLNILGISWKNIIQCSWKSRLLSRIHSGVKLCIFDLYFLKRCFTY